MRKAALFLTPVILAGSFLFACEDDSSGGGPQTFNPDAGSFDASPPPPNVDGGTPDEDVTPLPPPAVTVNVTRGAGPAEGVLVIFHDPNGAVVSSARTNAAGQVISSGRAPAQVTVALGKPVAPRLLTYVAVEAGDVLNVTDDADDGETSENLGSYAVTLPGPQALASYYDVNVGPCTGDVQDPVEPVAVRLRAPCLRASNGVLARAVGEGGLEAFALKKGNAPPAKGTTASVVLTAWETPGTLTVNVTNAPGGSFGSVRSGVVLDGQYIQGYGSLYIEGSSLSAPVEIPKGADAHQFALFLSLDGNYGSQRGLIARVAGTATTAALDMAGVLPSITDASIDSTDVVRPTTSWTSDSLAATKGGAVFLDFHDESHGARTWEFVVPPGTTSVRAPALPADAADWAPVANDAGAGSEYDATPTVLFVDSSLIPDYRMFVREAGRFIPADARDQSFANVVLPADGTAKITMYEPARL